MAVHYEVEAGKSLVIDGPANVIVKTGGVPIVGTGARTAAHAEKLDKDSPEATAERAKARK
jgi:hypothetical protein